MTSDFRFGQSLTIRNILTSHSKFSHCGTASELIVLDIKRKKNESFLFKEDAIIKEANISFKPMIYSKI